MTFSRVWRYTSTLNDITVNVAQLSLIYDDVDEDSFPVQIVQVHPNYNAATLANNIALIEVLLNSYVNE